MKKLLFLLLLIPMISIAQQKQDTITPTNPYEFADKQIDKVGNIIKELAEKLAVPAEHVYTVLIRQQLVKSFVWLTILIFSLYIIYKILRTFNRAVEHNIDLEIKGDEDAEGRTITISITMVILFITAVLAFMASLFFIEDIFTGFINLEYGAIKDILNMLN